MVSTLLSPAARVQMGHDLRQTIHELKDRGLLVASRWACELLSALPRESRVAPDLPFSPPPQPQNAQLLPHPESSPVAAAPRQSMEFLPSPGPGAFHDPMMQAGPSRRKVPYEEEDPIEEDEYQLAKSYFDVKEFDRVVFTLRRAQGKRSVFLRVYSAYLVGRRQGGYCQLTGL